MTKWLKVHTSNPWESKAEWHLVIFEKPIVMGIMVKGTNKSDNLFPQGKDQKILGAEGIFSMEGHFFIWSLYIRELFPEYRKKIQNAFSCGNTEKRSFFSATF